MRTTRRVRPTGRGAGARRRRRLLPGSLVKTLHITTTVFRVQQFSHLIMVIRHVLVRSRIDRRMTNGQMTSWIVRPPCLSCWC
jgi:hypothetical protein